MHNLSDAFAGSCLLIRYESQAAKNTGQTSLKGKQIFKSQNPVSHIMATGMKWTSCSVKWILLPLIHCIVMMEESYKKTLSAHCPRFQPLTRKGSWAKKLPGVFCPVVVMHIQVTCKWHRSGHTGYIRSVYHMHFLRKAWKPSLTSILWLDSDPLYQKLKGH